MKAFLRLKGGSGSGHKGHSGRPGKRGGSLPGVGGGKVTLTSQEVAALHDFTWLTSQTINSELREGKVSTVKVFGGMSRAEQVKLMDSAIAKAKPLPATTTLYSKIDVVHMHREGLLKEGATIHNPGYLSTTTVKGGVKSYPGKEYIFPAVLELRAKKGTRGILPLQSVSHYPQEKEHLVRRGSSYKIEKIVVPENKYIDPYIIIATLED